MLNDDVLLCPKCGFNYLHQLSVFVANGTIEISIVFNCEECSSDSTLKIKQHKGQTFLEWQK